METLKEIFDPQFLLRNSVYISLLIGFVCPLVGVYVILRRLIFMGVALPQVSSCGIAFAFALHSWRLIPHLEGSSESGLALAGASVFALGAIILLSIFEQRRRGNVEGRIGTAYVVAGAFSILLLVKNPYGEHGLLERMRGEIIAVPTSDLVVTGTLFALIVGILFVFQKELVLISYDREMAVTLGKKALVWDGLLFLVIGLTISLAVLSVGPLVTFGFLILPPLIARAFARTMKQFSIAASLIGGFSAVLGFWIAYCWDLPVGPTDVALLGLLYALSVLIKKATELLVRES
jgi:ABC-type Mn2+/Zn2+ transport system permease subunit